MLPLLSHLAWLDRGVIGVAMLMAFFIARYWGALLPYLAELGISADARAGMRTALLYLANILGAAAGSILTGFVLMDHFGLIAIATALVVAGLVCVVLLVVALDLARWQKLLRAGLAAAVGVLALLAIPAFADRILENLHWKGAGDGKPFVDVVENRSGIITVDPEGTVYGHGIYDGRFNTDLKNDTNGVVRPYALSLFHPAPRTVLMIGLSSGSWAQVIANNPQVELADHRRDQSRLSQAGEPLAGGRLGAGQPQGLGRHRRRTALAAPASRPQVRRRSSPTPPFTSAPMSAICSRPSSSS